MLVIHYFQTNPIFEIHHFSNGFVHSEIVLFAIDFVVRDALPSNPLSLELRRLPHPSISRYVTVTTVVLTIGPSTLFLSHFARPHPPTQEHQPNLQGPSRRIRPWRRPHQAQRRRTSQENLTLRNALRRQLPRRNHQARRPANALPTLR